MGNYSHVLLFEQFLISLKVTQLTYTPAGFSIKLPVSTFGASWGTVQTGLHDYLLWARLEKRGSAKPRAPLVQGSHTLQCLLWTSKVQTSKSCKEQNLGGKKKSHFRDGKTLIKRGHLGAPIPPAALCCFAHVRSNVCYFSWCSPHACSFLIILILQVLKSWNYLKLTL